MLIRIVASLATVLATTFGEPVTRHSDEPAQAPPAKAAASVPVNVAEVVLSFGDALDELHNSLAYERDVRDARRVGRACDAVLDQYPALRDAVGEDGAALLVAAESMVDACRQGFADSIDAFGFEIIDGDYYTYRELSFTLTS